MMDNKTILQIAMHQSAIDLSCQPDDFRSLQNKVVISSENAEARKYLTLPFFCHLVSYGNNIVVSVDTSVVDIVDSYINKFEVGHCFETPNLYVLNKALEIIELGKVPFYCCVWSNLRSVRNAIKSGFRPAWVELTAKSKAFVDQLNQ